jgi:hypothetical protein
MAFLFQFGMLSVYICAVIMSQNVQGVLADFLHELPSPGMAERDSIFSTLCLAGLDSPCTTSSSSAKLSSTKLSSSTPRTSSTPRASSSTPTSLAITSAPISTSPSESEQTGYVLALTTVFTQPAACTAGFTEIASWESEIWENAIATEVDPMYKSCFPSQFYSSILATTSLSYFSALVCPHTWETYALNDTYIICCPRYFPYSPTPTYLAETLSRNFAPILPEETDLQRPGRGAFCTSYVGASELMDITSYDALGGMTILPTKASEDGTVILADAFDGIAATSTGTGGVPASTQASLASGSRTSLKSTSQLTSSSSPVSTTSKSASSPSSQTISLRLMFLMQLAGILAYL